jgi:ABC-2 type transport system ATP-binding protein
VESGTLSELRHLTRTSVVAELAREPSGLADLPGVHDLHAEGKRVRCQVDAAGLDGLLVHLTPFGVRSLISQPPTLEDLFLRHYGVGEPEAQHVRRTGVAG